MADDLQALLERIKKQGLDQAEAEGERVVGEAREQAKKVVANAQAEAEKIVADAKREAELMQTKGKEALTQASRDVLLSLREQLQQRMALVVAACVGQELTGDTLGKVVTTAVKAYFGKEGEDRSFELLVPEKEREALAEHLLGELGKDFEKRVELSPVKGLTGGFKLNLADQKCLYDFSDEALSEALCAFLNPRLAALVKGE